MREIERAAYHEAGHAVAAMAVGRRFRRVTIVPRKDSLGRCAYWTPPARFRPDVSVSLAGRVLLERMTITALGGGMALVNGRSNVAAGGPLRVITGGQMNVHAL